jgi:hypothetical protein
MAEPKDPDSMGSKDESQKIEDVGEPHIASLDHSSDSSAVEKKEEKVPEEAQGNEDILVDRTEIEEQFSKISLKDSPEEEDHKEPCCTEIGCTPQLKSVKEKDIDDCIYHLKWIVWHDRKAPIVTQNENGPCPLIAISNILLLRGKIMLPSAMEIITAKELMEYIGDMILQNVPKVSMSYCMPLLELVEKSVSKTKHMEMYWNHILGRNDKSLGSIGTGKLLVSNNRD